MKNQLSVIFVAVAAALLSVPAYATCGHCDKNPQEIITKGGSGGAGGTASGGAGGSSSSSSSSNSNSNASNGDQVTAIDNSNHSRTINFQAHQHIPAMTVGAGSSVTSTLFACGPLQSVSQEKVAGHVIGIFGEDTIDDLGKTEILKPYMVDGKLTRFHKEIDGDTTTLWGHQVLVSSTVVGVAGGRSFSIGGARADSSANGGAGANGSMQRMVKEITLRDCLFSSKTITQLPKVASVVTPIPKIESVVIPKELPTKDASVVIPKELPMVVGNIKE